MEHSDTISLDCPHCQSKCQFREENQNHVECKTDKLMHSSYYCTHCKGKVITRWIIYGSGVYGFNSYVPSAAVYKPRVDLCVITNNEIRKDFEEAISCYNHSLYNACMIMARRAIQQEMMTISEVKDDDNLYKQIESMGISQQLKSLLKKIKNFGNYGAHPDFCLFNKDDEVIEDERLFSKLSLEFLDRYFSDQYEINALVNSAPKSKKELEATNKK